MSHHSFDFIIAGNYLTSMIAALELARSGKKVCLLNPTPTWGGHFTKIMVNGHAYDPGAISHEFTAFNETNLRDPLQYTPVMRNDWGRFAGLIEDYTRSHIELVKMQTPQTVYNEHMYDDIIMTNRLDVLQAPQLKGRIAGETAFILQQEVHPYHARNKKNNPDFLTKSYYEVSLLNHGATLHSGLFEPYFHKMSNLSTTRLIARYHRIGWLPLYYPETIHSQFTDKPQQLSDTHFCYPKAGYIAVFAETLLQRIEEAGVVISREPIEQVKDEPGTTTVYTKDGQRYNAPKLIWSLTHDQLISQVTGQPPHAFERWSASLAFLTIPVQQIKKDFSVLWSPDDRTLFYRACNQTNSAGKEEAAARITVEFNPDYLRSHGLTDDAAILQRLRQDFCTLGIVEDPSAISVEGYKTLKNVLLLPCVENWNLLEKERDILYASYPRVHFTRNTDAFFTDTLNDQIIKGLRIAAEYK
ncbi:MAG TPA: NAD(P)/FAD-dependent oxidoreductase [Lacibacter sp.]|nr:NAD(P)/FAD-dependent oxidoreductase [Lacibacter sp.]HMO90233.1 NAD(P)/FAD-dependent oxidoreductase [Lacibacter sp.]